MIARPRSTSFSRQFAHLFETVYWYEFDLCVSRYQGNLGIKTFTCWEQFLVMSFAQFCYRESLRDIEYCLESIGSKLLLLEPKQRMEYFRRLSYFIVFLNSVSTKFKSSTYPRKPFLESFNFFSINKYSSAVITEGLLCFLYFCIIFKPSYW